MATVQSWLDSWELETFAQPPTGWLPGWLLWYPAASLIDGLIKVISFGKRFLVGRYGLHGPRFCTCSTDKTLRLSGIPELFFLLETLKSLKFGWSPLVQCDKGSMDFLENVWEHCRCKWLEVETHGVWGAPAPDDQSYRMKLLKRLASHVCQGHSETVMGLDLAIGEAWQFPHLTKYSRCLTPVIFFAMLHGWRLMASPNWLLHLLQRLIVLHRNALWRNVSWARSIFEQMCHFLQDKSCRVFVVASLGHDQHDWTRSEDFLKDFLTLSCG